MQESVAVEEVQSDGHNCDVALRKIVTRALAGIPKESFLKSLSNLIQSVCVCVCVCPKQLPERAMDRVEDVEEFRF